MIGLLGILLFASLSVCGVPDNSKEPLPRWRLWLQAPIPWFGRLFFFGAGFYWINVKGSPAPTHKACIYAINHTSFLDPIFMGVIHVS